MAENPNSIGQIRELIFGETIGQIEQHFKALEEKIAGLERSATDAKQKLTELESQSGALEKKITETANDSTRVLRKELSDIRDSLSQRIDALANTTTNRLELSEWFKEISTRLKNTQSD